MPAWILPRLIARRPATVHARVALSLALAASVLAVSALAACGGSDLSVAGPPLSGVDTIATTFIQSVPHPLVVQVTADGSHASAVRLPSATGGTIAATGADGTHFTLTVPAGALPTDTTVTLTPVQTIASLPFGSGTVAVQFAPEGLQLRTPAILTIQPAAAIAAAQLVGFGYYAAGNELHLEPTGGTASAITLVVSHFSGAGATAATTAAVAQQVALHAPTAAGDQFAQTQAALNRQTQEGTATIAQRIAYDLSYYDQVVHRELIAGLDDDAAFTQGSRDGLSLLRDLTLLSPADAPPGVTTEILTLVEQGLRRALDRAYKACAAQHDYTRIERIYSVTRQLAVIYDKAGAETPIDTPKLTSCAIGAVVVTPATATIGVGDTHTFTATLETAAHETLANADSVRLSWTSSSAATAAVAGGATHQGTATGLAGGTTSLIAAVLAPAWTAPALGLAPSVEQVPGVLTVTPSCARFAGAGSWSGTFGVHFERTATSALGTATVSQGAGLTATLGGRVADVASGATWTGAPAGADTITDRWVDPKPPKAYLYVDAAGTITDSPTAPSFVTVFVDTRACTYDLSATWSVNATVNDGGKIFTEIIPSTVHVDGVPLPAVAAGAPAELSAQMEVSIDAAAVSRNFSPGGPVVPFLVAGFGPGKSAGTATVRWRFTANP